MAKEPMKPFVALEILGLRNSIVRGQKDYPRELCEHLGCLCERIEF
jgi:hypothetical protein